ncbi:MAG: sensor histidine kinase [Lachnospiraceae bacterium]
MKLVVQPILENAIYYGMEAMDDDGIISVRGYQKDGDVFLEISAIMGLVCRRRRRQSF